MEETGDATISTVAKVLYLAFLPLHPLVAIQAHRYLAIRARTRPSRGIVSPCEALGVPIAIALAMQLSHGAYSVDVDRRRPTAQRLESEGLEGVPLGGCESVQGVARDQEAPIEVACGLLQTGGGVHHVAVEDDIPFAFADLAADHRPCMESRSQARRYPKLPLEHERHVLESRHDREEAGDWTRIATRFGRRPRHHHLVADVLVDLAAVVADRIRGEPKHAVQEAVDSGGSDPFG